MSADKLVRMANQIADFFQSQPEDSAVTGAADHMKSFWNPVMRRQIYTHLDAGGSGLNSLALEAVKLMRSGDQAVAKTKT